MYEVPICLALLVLGSKEKLRIRYASTSDAPRRLSWSSRRTPGGHKHTRQEPAVSVKNFQHFSACGKRLPEASWMTNPGQAPEDTRTPPRVWPVGSGPPPTQPPPIPVSPLPQRRSWSTPWRGASPASLSPTACSSPTEAQSCVGLQYPSPLQYPPPQPPAMCPCVSFDFF